MSDADKDTVLFDWTDTAQKQRWPNFPRNDRTYAVLLLYIDFLHS